MSGTGGIIIGYAMNQTQVVEGVGIQIKSKMREKSEKPRRKNSFPLLFIEEIDFFHPQLGQIHLLKGSEEI